jgi:hypothetical protein
MTAEGLAEARLVRADLHRSPLTELPPDPGEASTDVDDKPNPFSVPMADRYLRGVSSEHDATHLAVRPPSSREQHAGYIAARMFRAVWAAGVAAVPGVAVFGKGDGLTDGERADRVNACVRDKRLFAAIDPLDSIDSFLAVDGEERCASVAIVAYDLQHVAVAVASGRAAALGTQHEALLQRDGAWEPIDERMRMPILHGSVYAPTCPQDPSGTWWPPRCSPDPQADNSIMLRGLVLGGLEAAYQPPCAPWEAGAMYIAASAGCVVLRVSTGKLLDHPCHVRDLLISALRKGERVPALIAARHELAAHRCLVDLRRSGIA